MESSTAFLTTLAETTAPGSICRGSVDVILEDGHVFVTIPGETPLQILCDVLRVTSEATLTLAPGMRVLVLLPASDEELGCILGATAFYAPPPEPAAEQGRVLLDAQEQLKLTCGESSLELRADGRILLKGVDVVTRAKRTHKIKAGTVAIN